MGPRGGINTTESDKFLSVQESNLCHPDGNCVVTEILGL